MNEVGGTADRPEWYARLPDPARRGIDHVCADLVKPGLVSGALVLTKEHERLFLDSGVPRILVQSYACQKPFHASLESVFQKWRGEATRHCFHYPVSEAYGVVEVSGDQKEPEEYQSAIAIHHTGIYSRKDDGREYQFKIQVSESCLHVWELGHGETEPKLAAQFLELLSLHPFRYPVIVLSGNRPEDFVQAAERMRGRFNRNEGAREVTANLKSHGSYIVVTYTLDEARLASQQFRKTKIVINESLARYLH